MGVKLWGTGRKDYSTNVEESVIPIVRSYQVNAHAIEQFELDSGEEKDVEVELPFSPDAKCHFIFHIDISVDANVLIGTEIWSEGVKFISGFGYQAIEIDLPQSWGISEITLKIKNYGGVKVKGAYSHNGVQGTEDIMPILIED